MTIQYIGKGLCRVVIKSDRLRKKVAKIPNTRIEGERVYFPREYENVIQNCGHSKKLKKALAELKQGELFK